MVDRRLRSALLLLIWQMPALLAFGFVVHVLADHGHHHAEPASHAATGSGEVEDDHHGTDFWPSAWQTLTHGHDHQADTPPHDHAALLKVASTPGPIFVGEAHPDPEQVSPISLATEQDTGRFRLLSLLSSPDPPAPCGTSLLARLSILRI